MEATLRTQRVRWTDAAFGLLSLSLLGWVAWDATMFRLITDSPGADYWEHTTVLRALLEKPWRPSHPFIADDVSSPRFGPHFLFVALLGRVLGADALGAMAMASILNTVLFLAGIRLLFREYFRDTRAPLVGLVVMFGSWLDAPHFSNVYKLSIFFSVAGYPSTAALAVMLFGLTLMLRLVRAERERPGLWALGALVWGYVYVTHPLTAMLAFTAAALIALTEPGLAWRRRAWALGSLPSGLLLASLWPYYPALGMVARGTAARVEERMQSTGSHELHRFYGADDLFGILGFCLLVLPFFVYFIRRRTHLVVPLGTFAMLAVFAVSPRYDIPLGHRFVLLAVFFLQIGLVWLLLSALSLRPEARGVTWSRALRWGPTAAAIAVLAFMAVSNVVDARARFSRHPREPGTESSTVRYARRVAELAGPRAIVLADPLASWPLPTFGPKVVSLHHRNPLIRDGAERNRLARHFFSSRASDDERRAILERFDVTHVVVTPRRSPAALRFLARIGDRRGLPLGRLLFRVRDLPRDGSSSDRSP